MTNPAHDRLEPLRRIARLIPGAMALGRQLRRAVDPDLREIARIQKSEAERLLQPFPDTFEDRYPDLFDALAERLSSFQAPRILSFGCSSGAEVRALRQRIPNAQIVGIDLNQRALARAQAADPAGDYRIAGAPPPDSRFNAILAMAVLRHGQLEADRPTSCAGIMPFSKFSEALAALDAALEPGGWLAMGHAHFRFADWPGAARYVADSTNFPGLSEPAWLYGADNQQLDLPGQIAVLHQKLHQATGQTAKSPPDGGP